CLADASRGRKRPMVTTGGLREMPSDVFAHRRRAKNLQQVGRRHDSVRQLVRADRETQSKGFEISAAVADLPLERRCALADVVKRCEDNDPLPYGPLLEAEQ